MSAQSALSRISDPAQLRQQLWNLINNGDTRKFQTPGILASRSFYRQTSGTRARQGALKSRREPQ